MQSGCNHVDWDYEEVADEKDLIIMKQKSGLEVPTRVVASAVWMEDGLILDRQLNSVTTL
ncbi:hypothetical protein A2U01_0034702, partial [Trifolium medium]|nr:hypothetical protein [Trifolium medium]